MYKLFTFLLLLTPASVAFAAQTPQTINDIFIGFASSNMEGLIPVVVLVAFITFLSGLVSFVNAGDNEEKRASGRQVMLYGIIILFVMVSYWGFVKIIYNTFFSGNPGIPNYLPIAPSGSN